MIYGWGKKSKDWVMPDGFTLICSYSYVSLMFVFKFVWSRKWHLIGRDRAMDVETTRSDLEQVYGPGNVPDIGVFERFGMFITGGLIVLAALGSMAVQAVLGTNDSSSVAAGALAGEPVAVVIDSDEEIANQADGSITDDGSGDVPGDNASLGESDSPVGESPSDDTSGISPSASDGSSESDSESGTAEPGEAAEPGADAEPGEQEQASASSIYEAAQVSGPVGGQSLVSTNAGNPTQGWSDLTVDRAYATSVYGESQADPGEKYLAVEYQLLGATAGLANLQNSAFRLDVDGVYYSPTLTKLNTVILGGAVVNSVVVFTIPAGVVDFRFEVGALDPDGDGYQANFDMALSAAKVPEAPERFAGPDQTGVVTRLSKLKEFTGVPGMSQQQPPLEVEILGASATAKVGPDAAEPGFKFLLVEVQVRSKSGFSNIQDQTFRVAAEGELYTGFADLNKVLFAGDSWNGVVRFEVPAGTSTAELEVGVPTVMEGDRAVFQISLK